MKRLIIIVLILSLLIGNYVIIKNKTKIKFDSEPSLLIESFNPGQFSESISNSIKYKANPNVRILVIPHHLVADRMIAGAYESVSANSYKRIIIIGPDHFTNSSREILTSKSKWQTPFGVLYSDDEFIGKIENMEFVFVDDDEIMKEHSINSHIPYIQYFFKNVEIIPIAISKNTRLTQLQAIIDLILDESVDETLLIASIDFSHYLPLQEADKRDEVTLEILKKRDLENLMGLNDQYMDSPLAMSVVLDVANKLNLEMEVVDHSNSAHYLSKNARETTSYFIIRFLEDEGLDL